MNRIIFESDHRDYSVEVYPDGVYITSYDMGYANDNDGIELNINTNDDVVNAIIRKLCNEISNNFWEIEDLLNEIEEREPSW